MGVQHLINGCSTVVIRKSKEMLWAEIESYFPSVEALKIGEFVSVSRRKLDGNGERNVSLGVEWKKGRKYGLYVGLISIGAEPGSKI